MKFSNRQPKRRAPVTKSCDEDGGRADSRCPEHPTAQSLSYYIYKAAQFACTHCAWIGEGSELEEGEILDAMFEVNCPACHTNLSYVSFPSIAEARANWANLSGAERIQIESIERRQALFDQMSLKLPGQLPNITMPEFILYWDFAETPELGSTTLIRFGDQTIFSEPAFYEGFTRYMEVATILKTKYGNALRDVIPTKASSLYLYGDSLSSPAQIDRFRLGLFGQISE